jgi:splicing factor 3A subunit 3
MPGWETKGTENGPSMPETVIDLDYYSTVEELMEVAPEKLKEVNLSSISLST